MRGSTRGILALSGILFLGVGLTGCSSETAASPEANQGATTSANQVAAPEGERTEPKLLSLGGNDATAVSASNQHVDEALALIKNGRLSDGLQRINLAIATAPTNANAFFERGKLFDTLGQTTGAIADYSVAVQLDPTNARYVNQLGYHYLKRNVLQHAKAQFSRAIDLDSSYAVPYNNRALVFIAEKRFDEAIADFETALKLHPEYYDALSNKGFAYYQSEQYDKALATYEVVLKKAAEKDKANVYNNRGLVYYHKREFDKAIDDFSQAIALDPNNPQYFKHRMTTYSKMKNKEAEAEQDRERTMWLTRLGELNREIAQSPRESKKYLERAAMFESQTGDQYAQLALTNYEQAAKADPHNTSVFVMKAEYCSRQGDHEQAIIDCLNALQIEPENRSALSLLGDAHYALEQFDQACKAYSRTGRIDNQVVTAYQKYAAQLKANGQTAEAKTWQEKAAETAKIESLPSKPEPQQAPSFDPALLDAQ
ncbi:MAG: hypothetical protein CMJ46_00255 [Planctomyces sp.]|nr:hypothetical protein [Planctomyces sp.]